MTTATKRKVRVGSIGVDSGQIMIVDPCYVLDDDYRPELNPTGGKYDEVCRATIDRNHGETSFGAFATSTLHGDGVYPVVADLDEHGRIIRLTISFE